MQTIKVTPLNDIVKLFRNVLFLIQTSWICFTEIPLYFYTKNYDLFIKRFTKRLASINILYVKVFQSSLISYCVTLYSFSFSTKMLFRVPIYTKIEKKEDLRLRNRL